MDLSRKVVLITGGASGIGASCVEEFLKTSIKGVVVVDINDGDALVTNLNNKYGSGRVISIKTDVSDEKSFDNAFQEAIRKFGNIDILVNCAGLIDEINWRKLYQVNLLGVVLGCQLALDKYFPKYASSPDTYIINIASIVGMMPYAMGPHYAASKHAIVGLTRSYGANKSIAKQRVCIMALCPGLTETPFVNSLNPSKIVYTEFLEEEKASFSPQTPEVVGRSVVEILKKTESGSIWIINDGVLFKIDLPTYETLIAFAKV